MDYYYALLDSYDLLKQRKFKLSIREQEGEEDGEPQYDAAEAQATIQQIGTAIDPDSAEEQNGIKVYKKEKTDAEGGVSIEYIGVGPRFAATLLKDGQLNPNNKDGADQLIQQLMGSGEAEGEEGEEGEGEEAPPEEQNPMEGLEGATDNLEGIMYGTPEQEGMFTKEVDENGKEITQPSHYFPGYEPTKAKSRIQKVLNTLGAIEAGEEQGLGIRGAAKEDTAITDKLLASPNLDPEDVAKALETVETTMEVVRKINSGAMITADDLEGISANVEVTRQGVMFNGIYFQYLSKSNAKNDLFRNGIDQVNDQIKKHNKENCPSTESEAGKNCKIPTIDAPKTTGRTLALRGYLVEHSAVLSDLATQYRKDCDVGDEKGCAEMESKIEEAYESMLEKGTTEQAKEMFRHGLCAAGNQCLIDIEGADDAVVTQMVIDYLVNEQEMDEDKAIILVHKAAEMDDGGSRAMVILVASTRGFNQYTETLDILTSEVYGQTGADLKGQKSDVRRTVTPESMEKFKKMMEDNMSDTEKKLEEAAQCGGEGMGMGSLGTEDENGNIMYDTEVKARTSTKKGRTKMGEGLTTRMSELCTKGTEGWNPLESEFVEANDIRIDKCSKASGKDHFGGKTAREAACGVQSRVDEAMQNWKSVAQGKPVVDEEGQTVKSAGEMMVSEWARSKSETDLKAKKRSKLASSGLAAMARGGTPTTEEREALTKIGLELEQGEINKQLDSHTDKDGTLTGEGLGYVLYRQGLDGGSLDECVKDLRGLEDNSQRIGLVNTTTYGSMGMVFNGDATVTRSGNSVHISTNEGERLTSGSFERGQYVAAVDNNALTETERRNVSVHGESVDELLMMYLQGQQALLEKLMNQTT